MLERMPVTLERPNTSALEELRSDPSSRKRFLRALGTGAAAATLTTALAACGKKKAGGNQIGGAGVGTAQYGQGDAGIVNYALALEYVEDDFYRQVVDSGALKGRRLDLAKRFGAQEQEHVATLEGTVKNLGATPTPKPSTSFTLDNEGTVLTTMNQLEAIGAAAYLGQVDRIQSKELLAAALAIHTVEARHAAVISMLLGKAISPDGPFARPITSVEVLEQIRPFLSAA
jgi:ferritin-like protein